MMFARTTSVLMIIVLFPGMLLAQTLADTVVTQDDMVEEYLEALEFSHESMIHSYNDFLGAQTVENRETFDSAAIDFASDLCDASFEYLSFTEQRFALPTDDPNIVDAWLDNEYQTLDDICVRIGDETGYSEARQIITTDFIPYWKSINKVVEKRRSWLIHSFVYSLADQSARINQELRGLQVQFETDAVEAIDWTDWELVFQTAEEQVATIQTALVYEENRAPLPAWSEFKTDSAEWAISQEASALLYSEFDTLAVLQAEAIDAFYQIAAGVVFPSTAPSAGEIPNNIESRAIIPDQFEE